jgi:surface polysaccharide O-acyltransferase-like enzyme
VPAAVVVALLTPLSREWWWPTLLHPRLEAYIRPVGGFGVFSLFPSIGYVLVGAFIGTRIAEAGAGAARFQGRLALWGACVAALGLGLLMIPALNLPTPSSSPAAFMCRTGAMMLGLAAAWVVVRRRPTVRWSPLVVLGQTSLFVYWVHVELAYGVFSFPVRHRLDLPASLVAYACLTLLMVGAASLWQRRPTGPLIPLHMRLPPSRQTEG